jgi:deoxyxylulose-5-phosphate synthase
LPISRCCEIGYEYDLDSFLKQTERRERQAQTLLPAHLVFSNFAAGLAKRRLLPVYAIYSTLLQRAFDKIFQDIALKMLPIVIAIDRADLCHQDGPTHHEIFNIAFLRSILNLIIIQSKNGNELRKMLEAAVYSHAPCYVRYLRAVRVPMDDHCTAIELGRSEIIQQGEDICIIALEDKISVAMAVTQNLPHYSSTTINIRFIRPLDEVMFMASARDHKKWIYEKIMHKYGNLNARLQTFLFSKISLLIYTFLLGRIVVFPMLRITKISKKCFI